MRAILDDILNLNLNLSVYEYVDLHLSLNLNEIVLRSVDRRSRNDHHTPGGAKCEVLSATLRSAKKDG